MINEAVITALIIVSKLNPKSVSMKKSLYENHCLLLMLDIYQNQIRCLYILFSTTTGQK